MEVTQFTYFQQVGGIDCKPITGEITYGLERLAMYLQGRSRCSTSSTRTASPMATSSTRTRLNRAPTTSSTAMWTSCSAFGAYEKKSQELMSAQLALPAYEQLLKAGHTFNLLDARGAISVTERAAYIGRIRNLARAVAQSYVDSRARLGFPMAPKAWADEVIAQIELKNNKEGGP